MGRVLVITGGYYVEHAKKDLGIVRELRRRAHRVTYVVVGDDVPPPYPRRVVEAEPDFRAVESVWVERLPAVIPFLRQCDVLLIPIHKGVGALSDWAHRLGKVVVQHHNHGGFDVYYNAADLVGVRGPYFAEFVRQRWGLAEDAVVPTGCVQLDAAVSPEVRQFPREEFCRLYRLDPRKRIAVWLPTREDRQHRYYDWSKAKYREICEIVARSTNHSLIIKPHPGDYLDHEQGGQGTDGRHWWETVFSGAPVCRPEHNFVCFRHSDVGLANWSTTGLEFPIFRRPFLYVDVADNPRLQYLRDHPMPDQPIGFYQGTLVPGFVGQVCTSAELPHILETCSYDVQDETLYERHIARFLYKADGRAYERVADLVERGLLLSAAQPRRSRPGAVMGLYLHVWSRDLLQRLRRVARGPFAAGNQGPR